MLFLESGIIQDEFTVHILELVQRAGATAAALYKRRVKPSRCETTPERVRRKQPQRKTQLERIDAVAQSVQEPDYQDC
jgi:hypothetical protein